MAFGRLIEEAKDLSNWLWDCMHGLAVDHSLRERLPVAAQMVSLHHHKALLILLENGSHQSFMALLRPQMDAWISGAWLQLCATEAELVDFARGSGHVTPGRMFAQLSEVLGGDVLNAIKKGRWKEMCDFTHTGILQLQRNFTEESIEANYPEEELVRALAHANACAVMAAAFAASIIGGDNLRDSLLARALVMAASSETPTAA